ncbi:MULTISPECIES: type I restriction endonuclease subunit R [Streptomyces]|uniref:Type I restriction enzyme endonuclease subunit n=1 Tax=Streptomyces tsukubensis (strain DSM 42081 / NBRC 108919 / NRRL 18488 / 9993) TaxID=1114943 RepID=I2N327_STRT9|nr:MULTISPECIES: type I restriction endonuclease subunit R [Streptomyces]AZK95536.1 DEAD/DEAH box helicase [Streptomyces tsukubensis]EIF91424.1 HsdR family type I site-specific deoxyribonuclease [Streptomyces tsukubensis NRRL18488]MYS66675.1 HsdR family type I site-specific deoxyribonuclease [Streptomyces sp. SID5473]QKM68424.1 type I restriction endonuclease subunit R [Streptomyces tsukubensis NRRL18488]TAI43242.1 type I restriction endonuclease subunit R [Streptomyces tsukubensis]
MTTVNHRAKLDRKMTESTWEHLAMDELGQLAWEVKEGKAIAPGSGHRKDWDDLILHDQLQAAIERLNPELSATAVHEALRIATDPASTEPYPENKQAHAHLTAGVRFTYTDEFGAEQTPTVRLVDFNDPDANTYLAVNQVTVRDTDGRHRRFDVVLYVNGLPLAAIELKSASAENATLKDAHAQLQTYVAEFPIAFRYNVLSLVSDGITAKYGTVFTPYEHFAPWNVDHDGDRVDTNAPDYDGLEALNLALHGLFTQSRFLSLTRNFVNFTPTGKRIAKPHQYFAVTKAVEAIVTASQSNGQAGVVWHTQGAGKSEEMVETSALVSRHPALNNPTVVVVTDRNDLDDQLYDTFRDSQTLLGQEPRQVNTREELRTELKSRTVGGIIFTTLQKFGLSQEEKDSGAGHPLLSERRNILVVVDEAHRSHYDSLDGYARHLRDALPYATLIAFTGTPISKADADTRAVFGEYIDIYDLKRAVDDEATVRVFHEPRVIDVSLPPDVDPSTIDEQANALTEGMDDAERRRAVQYAATMNTVYGAPDRIATLADDLISHWEKRRELMKPDIGGPGKAMIVCATREICVRVYDALAERRPEWASGEVDQGVMKIVFHGDRTDEEHLRKHALLKSQQKTIQARAKNPEDALELLIVHSMLLTGYDAPPIHTLYMDRPMRGANLMQALARVNRRFRGKQDGLLVGYAPLTDNLSKALEEYSRQDQQDKTLGADIDRAITEVKNELATIKGLLAGSRWRELLADTAHPEPRKRALRLTSNFLRDPKTPGNKVEPGTKPLSVRFKDSAARLDRFYRICAMSKEIAERCEDLEDWRRDIAFFSEVRAWMIKLDAADREATGQPVTAEIRRYLEALAASVVDADEITDLYEEAGIGRLDITRLNDTQLRKLENSETSHLVTEALRRMIEQKMREVTKHNVVRHESFSERLNDLMTRYMLQQLTSAQAIAELAALARQVSDEARRGERFDPPLNHAELAFYDAVAHRDMAELMEGGDDKLAQIARALVADVRKNLSVDWLSREPVRAKLRTRIRRVLAMFDYPPEEELEAIDLVLKQMETFAAQWAPGAK